MASSGAAGICQCSYFMVRLTFFLFGKYGMIILERFLKKKIIDIMFKNIGIKYYQN